MEELNKAEDRFVAAMRTHAEKMEEVVALLMRTHKRKMWKIALDQCLLLWTIYR